MHKFFFRLLQWKNFKLHVIFKIYRVCFFMLGWVCGKNCQNCSRMVLRWFYLSCCVVNHAKESSFAFTVVGVAIFPFYEVEVARKFVKNITKKGRSAEPDQIWEKWSQHFLTRSKTINLSAFNARLMHIWVRNKNSFGRWHSENCTFRRIVSQCRNNVWRCAARFWKLQCMVFQTACLTTHEMVGS